MIFLNSKGQGQTKKAKQLIDLIKKNPYQSPPSIEKLKGDLKGTHFRRINIHNRLVYEVFEDTKQIKIIRLWTRYE